MRWRPWMWLTLSMLCFMAAVYFWHLGDEWAAQKSAIPGSNTNQLQPKDSTSKSLEHSVVAPPGEPMRLLSQAGHVNSPQKSPSPATNQVSRTAHRLSNTTLPFAQLLHSDKAVLLEN